MMRIPGIPFLPGTTITLPTKTHNPRVMKFMTLNGINMLSDRKPPPVVNADGMVDNQSSCTSYELPSIYPAGSGPKLPAWLVYDNNVLCFMAYFKQNLEEVYRAPYQVRKVKILYYLEDGTMQVSEPRVENSGIPQGCLVGRQRIPRPKPCHHEFISVMDLNVNRMITIFDRIYHITDCDGYTRNFLNNLGISVPEAIPTPPDPSFEIRRKSGEKQPTPSHKNTDFKQFLKYDRKILKFSGYWDDRSEFGEVRNLEINYYLADDTIDVKEIYPVNSGRDSPALFLKRGKLQKCWTGLPLPGAETNRTILNVLGGGLQTGRYIEDILGTGSRDVEYYKDCDLQVGCHLNIFGRDIVLTDCDGFTKEYYRKKYGIEDFTPHDNLAIIEKNKNIKKERILPPFNGWGTHEDSEANCISVEPKPPHRDFKKFIKLDRFILRFGAKMLSNITENCLRIFVISYYLATDEISIYELAERNTGFLGGEFRKRARIPIPKQLYYTSDRLKFYQPHHFFIGATINLGDHVFHIKTADEYTLLYMEKHPFEFPLADVKLILTKIRETIRPNYRNFINEYLPDILKPGSEENPYIPYEQIRCALVTVLGENITEQEIITLCRSFSSKDLSSDCIREKVRASIHLILKRNLWDELDRLQEHLYHLFGSDIDDTKFISDIQLRSVIRACRLPFSTECVDDILRVLETNKNQEYNVCDFINFIDVNGNPAHPIVPLNIAFELCPKMPVMGRGKLVNWRELIDAIGLEANLLKETE